MKALNILVCIASLLCSLNSFAVKHPREENSENTENIEPKNKRMKVEDIQESLSVAVEWNYVETVQYLLNMGLDPNALDSQSRSPLQIAFSNYMKCDSREESNSKKSMKIIAILLASGAKLNSLNRDDAHFLLQQATLSGEVDLVHQILARIPVPQYRLCEILSHAIKQLFSTSIKKQQDLYFAYMDIICALLKKDFFIKLPNLSVEDANLILDAIMNRERVERERMNLGFCRKIISYLSLSLLYDMVQVF